MAFNAEQATARNIDGLGAEDLPQAAEHTAEPRSVAVLKGTVASR